MGLGPTQGDEKRLLFSNYSPWQHRPPLCAGNVFRQRGHAPLAHL